MIPGSEFLLAAEDIRRGVKALPSFPAAVLELLHSIDDDDADVHLLVRKISRDHGLVTRMLRVANSSFYGLQGRVGSIEEAVVVLGLRGVRMLAMAAAVSGTLKAEASAHFDVRIFWRHSIAAALAARAIARRLHLNEENAFVAGLLHDIGFLALASCFPRHIAAVGAYQEARDCPLIEAEKSVLGVDHAEVGFLLIEHWKLPSQLCEAIAAHHAPAAEGQPALSGALHLANAVAHALDLTGDPREMVPVLVNAPWLVVMIARLDMAAVFAEVDKQFAGACETLVG